MTFFLYMHVSRLTYLIWQTSYSVVVNIKQRWQRQHALACQFFLKLAPFVNDRTINKCLRMLKLCLFCILFFFNHSLISVAPKVVYKNMVNDIARLFWPLCHMWNVS